MAVSNMFVFTPSWGNNHQLDEVVSNFQITASPSDLRRRCRPRCLQARKSNKVGRQKLVPSNFWICYYYASYRICSKVVCCWVCKILYQREVQRSCRNPRTSEGIQATCSMVRAGSIMLRGAQLMDAGFINFLPGTRNAG